MKTPQTLDEAIRNASRTSRAGLERAHVREIKAHVRDYLAQRFGAWMLKVEIGDASTLKKLFDAIVEDET